MQIACIALLRLRMIDIEFVIKPVAAHLLYRIQIFKRQINNDLVRLGHWHQLRHLQINDRRQDGLVEMMPMQTNTTLRRCKMVHQAFDKRIGAAQWYRITECILMTKPDHRQPAFARGMGQHRFEISNQHVVAIQLQRGNVAPEMQQIVAACRFQHVDAAVLGGEGKTRTPFKCADVTTTAALVATTKQPGHIQLGMIFEGCQHRTGTTDMPIAGPLHAVKDFHQVHTTFIAIEDPSKAPETISEG